MSSMQPKHPYLRGNYAPIRTTLSSQPCQYEGSIPEEFAGGQYVRNGSNPLADDDSHGDLHWFDGDGMLTGVYFERLPGATGMKPQFTNQYVYTDVYCATRQNPRLYPIIPSMSTLVNPTPSPWKIMFGMLRAFIIIMASLMKLIVPPIKRVGSSNTSIFHHDGRVLATNEIGPPMRVLLPSLKTIGWFTGRRAEGEAADKSQDASEPYFGGKGVEGFYKEMTTAHPRVDPNTGELMLFHSTFIPPFVQYSIVPAGPTSPPRLNQPVPGISGGKLMHDFGVSSRHTVMIDCPISLDPSNLASNKSTVEYDPAGRTRLGVFPRYLPGDIEWYDTAPSVVMHTVNAWDEKVQTGWNVHLLLCRENSIAPLYTMGHMTPPGKACATDPECRLYYYQLSHGIIQQWALSAIPFEFPHVPRHLEMKPAKYVYGCSMRKGNFSSSFMAGVKIDCLAKLDVGRLLARGIQSPPPQVHGVVDGRSIQEVISSDDKDDPVKVFALPDGWYAQECSFVPRHRGATEDDGWIVTYVFDESQLENGEVTKDCQSELWIIDARSMKDVVAKVILPQRVPYGMHGNWFPEGQIQNQRGYRELRTG